MPQTMVGTFNCPHIYHEPSESVEIEFCDLNQKRCSGECKRVAEKQTTTSLYDAMHFVKQCEYDVAIDAIHIEWNRNGGFDVAVLGREV